MSVVGEGYDLRVARADRDARVRRARIFMLTERRVRKRAVFEVLRELLDERGRDDRDFDEPYHRLRERAR